MEAGWIVQLKSRCLETAQRHRDRSPNCLLATQRSRARLRRLPEGSDWLMSMDHHQAAQLGLQRNGTGSTSASPLRATQERGRAAEARRTVPRQGPEGWDREITFTVASREFSDAQTEIGQHSSEIATEFPPGAGVWRRQIGQGQPLRRPNSLLSGLRRLALAGAGMGSGAVPAWTSSGREGSASCPRENCSTAAASGVGSFSPQTSRYIRS